MKRNNRKRRKRLTPPAKPLVLELPESSPRTVSLSSISPDVILDLMRTSAQSRPNSGHPPHVPHLLAAAMMTAGITIPEALATVGLDRALFGAGIRHFGIKRRVTHFELLARLWAAMLDQQAPDKIDFVSRIVWEDIKARIEQHFPLVNEGYSDVLSVIKVMMPLLTCPKSREVYFETHPNIPPNWPFDLRYIYGFRFDPQVLASLLNKPE